MIAHIEDRLVNDIQIGQALRTVRIHLRRRQEDVARRAGVPQSVVSKIERGLAGTLPLQRVRAVAAALEVRIDLVASWRGGDLPRILNARHSALHERLAGRLDRDPGWESAGEVSYSIWGERGVIDRLAFHPASRMLAVFEIKADLADPAGLVAQVDRYRRLAPEIARSRGWNAAAVSCWAVVADTDTNRRRLAGHLALVRGAFPADSRQFRAWLRDPVGRVDGLVFLAYPPSVTGTRSLTAVKRVRMPRAT